VIDIPPEIARSPRLPRTPRRRSDCVIRPSSRIAPSPVSLRRLVALVAFLVLLGACASSTTDSTPAPLPEDVLLTDDFSRPNVGWARFDTEQSAVYVLAGELYLEDRGQGTAVYSPLIGHSYADVLIDVNVRHVQGAVNNWMGIMCRQQDEDNYYLLAISADGYYLILRVINGDATALVGPDYSTSIRTGKAANAFRAQCKGTEFTLWANDQELAAFQDDSLQRSGNVALFADAVQRGEIVVVAFDDFVLASP
jgi:hypothetical protein